MILLLFPKTDERRAGGIDPALSVVATGMNLAATRTVRLGMGHTRDVPMIEGEVEVLEIDGLPQQRGDRFVAHTGFDPRALAAARDSGGYFVFNVFDSAAAWESFRDERRAAALREAMPEGVPAPKVSIWELHSFASF